MAIVRADFPPQEKIAIVGKAPSSLGLAPYHDDAWQIWTLADLVVCKQAPRYDVHFELHAPAQVRPRTIYWDWLKTVQPPNLLFMREAVADVPNARLYPREDVLAGYGRYFTNTVSWMIALATALRPKEIAVYGVDMAQTPEYRAQRPSCEFYLGIAAGAGIAITVPAQSDLLKSAGLYGFEEEALTDMQVKHRTRVAELLKRIADTERLRDEKALEATYLQGAMEDCRDYWSQWLQPH